MNHPRTANYLETLLDASVELIRLRKRVATLEGENAALRSKLGEREQFDVSADSPPVNEPRVFFRRQI